jgi:hypothetical protein
MRIYDCEIQGVNLDLVNLRSNIVISTLLDDIILLVGMPNNVIQALFYLAKE